MGGSLGERVERTIREHDLIAPGGRVTCMVSGGADSTCLWHALHGLGYAVSALHVHHGVRGAAADADAEHCARVLGAEVIRVEPGRGTEAELRELRYASTARHGLRATGHTASDQVETVLYRLVSSGSTRGIKTRREDGVVRPLLAVWREETQAYCRTHGLPVRADETNEATVRGRIRTEILPALRRLDARAEQNLLALAGERARLPRTIEAQLVELLSTRDGSSVVDLGRGVRAVREYDALRLEGTITWGPWELSAAQPGLEVRSRRPGDRLAGRRKKVQDLLVDAKVPRAQRDEWPIVTNGDDVVAVPGVAEAPGWEGVVTATRGAT